VTAGVAAAGVVATGVAGRSWRSCGFCIITCCLVSAAPGCVATLAAMGMVGVEVGVEGVRVGAEVVSRGRDCAGCCGTTCETACCGTTCCCAVVGTICCAVGTTRGGEAGDG
jgi:hypothetical protein